MPQLMTVTEKQMKGMEELAALLVSEAATKKGLLLLGTHFHGSVYELRRNGKSLFMGHLDKCNEFVRTYGRDETNMSWWNLDDGERKVLLKEVGNRYALERKTYRMENGKVVANG